MITQIKKVEEYLNQVNYKNDPSYTPSKFALKFVTFIKLVNGGEGEENLTPVMHYSMLDKIDSRSQNICNMVFRGSGKTTVLAEYLFLYLAIYGDLPGIGKVILGMYVSDSIDNGVKNMRKNLEFRWENSEFLQQYIPSTRFTDVRWEFINIDGKKLVIKGYGAKSGVRGVKEEGVRPTLCVLDDLVSDEDARSPTVIASIEDTVYKAVDYALHPTKFKIIWSGTPFNSRDPLYKAVESGAWSVNVYPVCERFPCTREEFSGAWDDRFTYDAVMSKYNKAKLAGKLDTFMQELMLRIMSEKERLIKDNDIQYYSLKSLMSNISRYNIYITTDFATGEKKANDLSVISVWAVNSNKDWFWVDGIIKKQGMDKNIKDLFRLVQMYPPQSVGIEVSGQQGGFIKWIQEQMMDKNCFFTLASDNNSSKPGMLPSKDKMSRFQLVVPLFKAHKIYLPKERKEDSELIEILDELSLASESGFKSKYDDFIDTVSMIIRMSAWYPSEESAVVYDEGKGVWVDDLSDESSIYSSYIV